MLTRHRLAQPDAAAASTLKTNAASQPVSQRMTRAALGARDTNLLVELAAPLTLGGSGAPLKQTAIVPSRASSRSSKLAKLSSRVANLVAVVAAESEAAAKENPRSLTLELEDAQPQQSQPQQSSQQQPQGKENGATEAEEEEEAEEDATDRAWIEMNKQVTPMKKRDRHSLRKSVAASSSARKSLAPPSASARSQYMELHTNVLNDVAPTPFTTAAAVAATAPRKSLSLTPTPASNTTAARSRRRRSSTKGGALKFASSADDAIPALPQASADLVPAALTALDSEQFGASIPDEPSISGESEAEIEAPAARAMPTTCFTPTSYERRTRKSLAVASSPIHAAAFATRKSDRRSLHHTQLQLLKQLVAEDERTEQQQQLQQQPQQEEESVAVAVEAVIEPIAPAGDSVAEPTASSAAPIEPEVQSSPAAASTAAESSPAKVFEIRPLSAVIPAPSTALASLSPAAAVEPQDEIAEESVPVHAEEAVAVAAAVVRASPKRFAASARKARSLAPTTPSASAAAAAGPSRRAPATAARKSLFDASMRDEAAAASLFSSGLMRLTFHAGTPPATPAGLSGKLLTSPESAHKRKSVRNSLAQEAELVAEAETIASIPLLQSPARDQITGRSPARRRSLQSREQEPEIAEPATVENASDAAEMEQPQELFEAEQLAVPVPLIASASSPEPAQEQTEASADAERQQQEQIHEPQQLSTPVHSRRSTPIKQSTTPAATAAASAVTPRRSPLRSATKQLAAATTITPAPQTPALSIRSTPVRSTRCTPVHAAVAAAAAVATAAVCFPRDDDATASVNSSAGPSPIKQSEAVRVSPKRFAASARKARSLAPITPCASAAAGPSRRAPATAARKSLFDASMRDEAAAASLFSSGLMRLTFHAGTPPATPAAELSGKPALTSPDSAHKRKTNRNSVAAEMDPDDAEADAGAPIPLLQSPARDQITGRSPARMRSLQAREQEPEVELESELAPAIIEDVRTEVQVPVVAAAADIASPRRSPPRSVSKAVAVTDATPVRSPVRSPVRASPRAAAAAAAAAPVGGPVQPPQSQHLLSPDSAVSPSKRSRKSLLRVVARRCASDAEIPDAILQRLFTATKESVSPVQALSPLSSSSAGSSREVTPQKQKTRSGNARSPQKQHLNTPVPSFSRTDPDAAAVATPPPSSASLATPFVSPSAAEAATPSPPQKAASSKRRRSKRSPVPAIAAAAASAVENSAAAVHVAEMEALAVESEQPSVLSFVRSHPIQCTAVIVSFMSAAAALCYFI